MVYTFPLTLRVCRLNLLFQHAVHILSLRLVDYYAYFSSFLLLDKIFDVNGLKYFIDNGVECLIVYYDLSFLSFVSLFCFFKHCLLFSLIGLIVKKKLVMTEYFLFYIVAFLERTLLLTIWKELYY